MDGWSTIVSLWDGPFSEAMLVSCFSPFRRDVEPNLNVALVLLAFRPVFVSG